MTNSSLEQLFSHAYIIGGSPCSGKSTIAEMLSTQYGFHSYKADDYEWEHMRQARCEHEPVMYAYHRRGWDKIWSETPEKLVTDEITYYHERFPFILGDLKQLNIEKPMLLEGAAFLPDLIHQYPVRHENVLFMVPTFEFQVHHYSQRSFVETILKNFHDPGEAFENWMKRDQLFGLEVIRQANIYGYQVITVDGSINIQKQFDAIKALFQLDNSG